LLPVKRTSYLKLARQISKIANELCFQCARIVLASYGQKKT